MLKWIKRWYRTWVGQQTARAKRNGYVWAWTAWRLKGYTLETIIAKTFCRVDESGVDTAFTEGAKKAIDDIYATKGVLR